MCRGWLRSAQPCGWCTGVVGLKWRAILFQQIVLQLWWLLQLAFLIALGAFTRSKIFVNDFAWGWVSDRFANLCICRVISSWLLLNQQELELFLRLFITLISFSLIVCDTTICLQTDLFLSLIEVYWKRFLLQAVPLLWIIISLLASWALLLPKFLHACPNIIHLSELKYRARGLLLSWRHIRSVQPVVTDICKFVYMVSAHARLSCFNPRLRVPSIFTFIYRLIVYIRIFFQISHNDTCVGCRVKRHNPISFVGVLERAFVVLERGIQSGLRRGCDCV